MIIFAGENHDTLSLKYNWPPYHLKLAHFSVPWVCSVTFILLAKVDCFVSVIPNKRSLDENTAILENLVTKQRIWGVLETKHLPGH